MSSGSLALVSNPTYSRQRRVTLVKSAACVAPVSAWLGASYAGVIGVVVVACVLVGLGLAVSRVRAVQVALDRMAARRAHLRRVAQRDHAMHRASGPRRLQYAALQQLVDDLACWDAPETHRFELDELLDHFVALSVRHQQCVDALHAAGAPTLPTRDPVRARRCAGIAARRTRQRTQLVDRLDRVADELDSIDELVRLVADRIASGKLEPSTDGADEAISRRLDELDELDDALMQLSA